MQNTFDGYFNLIDEKDGYYVEIFAPGMNGKPVRIEMIEETLKLKGIQSYNLAAILEGIKSNDNVLVKITDKYIDSTYAGDKKYKVEVSEDLMKATITFYPGEGEYEVSVEELERDLRSRNVFFGIRMDLLKEIAKKRDYNKPYLIAEGIAPVDPVPGYVEYKFKTLQDFVPEIDDQGNVNYKKLSVVSTVQEGSILAELVQTIDGIAGKNLSGGTIPEKKGKPVRIKFGKNTRLSEDRNTLYAERNGLVKVLDGKIFVNDVYEVPNNVGPSTGDINFTGSVIVHGNVINSFTVKATGDIEIMGVVEGASVISGGNITLHSGIQGMGKGYVECAGDLQTKFIEQANVVCGGNLHSEAILHSTVTCKGEIKVEGKKGMISGGSVRATTAVYSKTIGSHMGTATEIEVGVDPLIFEEYNELRKSLPKMIEEADKLEKVIALLNKRKEVSGDLEEDKVEMYKSAVRNKVFLTNKISNSQKRIEELQIEVEQRHTGVVKVLGVIYPGVRVGIGNVYYHVKDQLQYVQLYKDGADVRLTSY